MCDMLSFTHASSPGNQLPSCDPLLSNLIPFSMPNVDEEPEAEPRLVQADHSPPCNLEERSASAAIVEAGGAELLLQPAQPQQPLQLHQEYLVPPHLVEQFERFLLQEKTMQQPQEGIGTPHDRTSPDSSWSTPLSSPAASPRVHIGRDEDKPRWAVEVGKDTKLLLDYVLTEQHIVNGHVSLHLIYIMSEVPCPLGGAFPVSIAGKEAADKHEDDIRQKLLKDLVNRIRSRRRAVLVQAHVEREDKVVAGLCKAAKRLRICRLVIVPRKSGLFRRSTEQEVLARELSAEGCAVVPNEGKNQSVAGAIPPATNQQPLNAGPASAGNQAGLASPTSSGLRQSLSSTKSKSPSSSPSNNPAAVRLAGVGQAKSPSPSMPRPQPQRQANTIPQSKFQQLLRMTQQQTRRLAEHTPPPSDFAQRRPPQGQPQRGVGSLTQALQGERGVAGEEQRTNAGFSAAGSQAGMVEPASPGSCHSLSRASSDLRSARANGVTRTENDLARVLAHEKLEEHLKQIDAYLERALALHRAYMMKDAAVIRAQVRNVIRAFPSLGLTAEVPEGVYKWAPPELKGERRLLGFCGTIPVVFQGEQYHIPVALVLCPLFPHVAPVCWVLPEEGMEMGQCHFVDEQGQCHLAGLHWKDGINSLKDAAKEMQRIFSKEPPVFSSHVATQFPANPPARATQHQLSTSPGGSSRNGNFCGVPHSSSIRAELRRTAPGGAASTTQAPCMLPLEPGARVLCMDFEALNHLYMRHKAEDEAADATMRELMNKVEECTLDLQAALKEVRRLAREQYYQRAAVCQLGTAIKLAAPSSGRGSTGDPPSLPDSA